MRIMIPISTRGLRLGSGLDPNTRRRVHATPWVSKSVKDKISEVTDKVNKKVGQRLASAIETGEKATEKTKKTLGKQELHMPKDKAKGHQTAQKTKQRRNDKKSRD